MTRIYQWSRFMFPGKLCHVMKTKLLQKCDLWFKPSIVWIQLNMLKIQCCFCIVLRVSCQFIENISIKKKVFYVFFQPWLSCKLCASTYLYTIDHWLISKWMLQWWQVIDSTTCDAFLSTHPLTPCLHLERPQYCFQSLWYCII